MIAASSFGTTICQRGIGASVRFASVRSSISFANAAVAIASTTSGEIEPASMPLNTTSSNSSTLGAEPTRNVIIVIAIGMAASAVMMRSRHLPVSWRRVRR